MTLNLPKQRITQHFKVDQYPLLETDVLQYNEHLIQHASSLNRDGYYIIKDFQFKNKPDVKIHIGHISNLILKDVLVKRVLSKASIAYLYTEYTNLDLETYAEKFGVFIKSYEHDEKSVELKISTNDRTCKFVGSSKMDKRSSLFHDQDNHISKMYDAYGPDVIRMCVLLSIDKKCLKISEKSIEEAILYLSKIRNYTRYMINNLYLENHNCGNVSKEIYNKMRIMIEKFDYFINGSQYDKAVKILVRFLSDYSKKMDKYFKMEFYEMDLSDPMRQAVEDEFYYIATKIQKLIYCIMPFLSTELNLKL
jgi:hypothetical protein